MEGKLVSTRVEVSYGTTDKAGPVKVGKDALRIKCARP